MRQTATRVVNGAMSQPAGVNDLIANAVRRDRQARRDKAIDKVAELIGQIVGVFLRGWFFMLAIGVIHHEWLPKCPTLGYGTATLVIVLISGALAIPSHRKS